MHSLMRPIAIAIFLVLAFAAPASAQSYPETIPLPNGFAPEGIASGLGSTLYTGSLAGQGIYRFDARTGEGDIFIEGTEGQPYVGMKHSTRLNVLFVAGGASGRAFAFDAADGELLGTWQLAPEDEAFINDVIVTGRAAYFTDSRSARFFALPIAPDGSLPAEDGFQEVALSGDWEQVEGFNSNGIAASGGGRTLIIVNSTTGILYAVNPATGEASAIDLGGETVTMGDGILLAGRTLYVVRNRANEIVEIRLSGDLSSGEVVQVITSDAFRVPTTIARSSGALYAVNARFGTDVTPDTDYDAVRVER